jgi:hypothetical protein
MTFSVRSSSWICASALWLGLAAPVAAQEGALRVRPADREWVSSKPREVVAATFTVSNLTAQAVDVESHVELPPGWWPVARSLSFVLPPGGSTLRLVSFTIPEDARAGEYDVRFEARDRLHPGVSDAYSLRVNVLGTSRLQVSLLDLPDFALAGDTLAGSAMFRNAGNRELDVGFVAGGRCLGDVSPRTGELRLQPGEVRRVELSFQIETVRARCAGRLTVTARAPGSEDVVTGGAFPVIPRATPFDAWRTLDSRVESRFVARDSPQGRNFGWQGIVAGSGVLDEDRKDLLRFQLRGPDRRQSGTFGASEENWLRYDSRSFDAGVGDLVFGLSPLTEPGRLARGAQFAADAGRWGVAAYDMDDVYGSSNADQQGIGTQLRVGPATLGANYLRREGAGTPGDIWSLRGRADSVPDFDVDLEVAQSRVRGLRGNALRFVLRDSRRPVQFYAQGWHADPEFLGPLRDKLYLSTGFDYPNDAGLGLRGYYRLQDWNLLPLELIDPDLQPRLNPADRMRTSPTESEASLGTGHALGGGRVTLDLYQRERRGGNSPQSQVNLRGTSWRAGLNRSWRRLSLFYSLERGEGEDLVTRSRFDTSSQMVSASLRAGRHGSLGAWWLLDENSRLDLRAPRQESAGVSASYAGDSGFTLKLDIQRSESAYGRAGIYDFALVRQAARGARLTLAARRIEGRFARTDVLLGWSMPFGLPVMRRPDVATVRGRVFDVETSAGLANVMLRLDGMVAATDSRGDFRFPAVRDGAHEVSFERGGTDVRQVPASAASLDVEVSGRRAAPLQIGMVRAVVIEARVTQWDGAEVRAAPGVLLEFANGEALYRRLTDADGRTRLGGVPPGRWRISAAEDTLPAGCRFPSGTVTLELAPGEASSTEIQLSRQQREMRMLAPPVLGQDSLRGTSARSLPTP